MHYTLRILGVLSRYENVGDLQPASITQIVLNDALRRTIGTEPDRDKQTELVKPFLLDIDKKTKAELEAAIKEKQTLGADLRDKDEDIRTLKARVASREHELSGLRKELADATSGRNQLEMRIEEMERQILKDRGTIEKRRQITQYARRCAPFLAATFIVPIVVLGLGGAAWNNLKLAMAIWGALAIGWVWLADSFASKYSHVVEWRPYQFLHKFKKLLFVGFFGVVIGAGLAGDIYKWLKDFLMGLWNQS